MRPGAAADRLLSAAAIGLRRFSIRQRELEKAMREAQWHLIGMGYGVVELGRGIVLLKMWKLRVAIGFRKLLPFSFSDLV